jgi:glutathione S-transferase
MPNLTFYTNPQSRGRIARWMLEEVGEPYDTVILDYGTTMKGADYLAINPMGKVPAIKHGDMIVTETPAICAYLADAFPQKGLAPPIADPRRGDYYRWMFFTAGPVEAAVTNKSLKVMVGPDQKAFVGYGSFEETIDALERAVSASPYICGDQFTAADVYVGSQIGWGLMFGTIEKRAAFEDYVGRLYARPAARRANELDDAAKPKPEPQPQPA